MYTRAAAPVATQSAAAVANSSAIVVSNLVPPIGRSFWYCRSPQFSLDAYMAGMRRARTFGPSWRLWPEARSHGAPFSIRKVERRLSAQVLAFKSELHAPGPLTSTTMHPARTTSGNNNGISIGPGHSSMTSLL